MRKWYKYRLNQRDRQRFFSGDCSYADHKESMQGYKAQEGYSGREEFFRVYFEQGAHRVRFKHYHNYLKRHLEKQERILSIGSGRCVNELLLMEDGFDITCSDLQQPCREETLRIFPGMKFVEYDFTSAPFVHKFDCIISLSAFYLFDKNGLLKIFENAGDTLNPGGRFIFDPGAAEDSFATYVLDEIICRFENWLRWLCHSMVKREQCVIARKDQGYRTKNQEIIAIAKKAGFILDNLECSDYLTESRRSLILSRLDKRLIARIGRSAPYVRMFTFIKKG